MRIDFKEATKRSVAHRVGYRCSAPGCDAATTGPGHESESHYILLGEAAHINAASPGGPRYDPQLSEEQCASIDNAIWLCRAHARMIDVDPGRYAAQTLRDWKVAAEQRAKASLITPQTTSAVPSTLIQLGDNLMFWAIWRSANSDQWGFQIVDFLEGNTEQFFRYCMHFSTLPNFYQYIIIESQGDGRQISEIGWQLEGANSIVFTVNVLPKFKRSSYHHLQDIALDDDGDLDLGDGDFKMIHGIEVVKQTIASILASQPGDWHETPLLGSRFGRLYVKYQHDPNLERIIKMEVVRLLTIPLHGGATNHFQNREIMAIPELFTAIQSAFEPPALDFVERVISVQLLGVRQLPAVSPALVHLNLELSENTNWRDTVFVAFR